MACNQQGSSFQQIPIPGHTKEHSGGPALTNTSHISIHQHMCVIGTKHASTLNASAHQHTCVRVSRQYKQLHANTQTHTHTHTYTHTNTRTHTHTPQPTQPQTCADAHAHAHARHVCGPTPGADALARQEHRCVWGGRCKSSPDHHWVSSY